MKTSIPVEVVPYDPQWPRLFQQEKELLLLTIGAFVVCIEHMGSTAVPGLAAKPVIDILIGVHRLEDAPLFIPPLEGLGYQYIPAHETVLPKRRYLHRIRDGRHTHHLHMVQPDSEFYKEQLLFRDHLRTNPHDAAAYAALKLQLAQQYRTDREAYTDAKSAFIREILERAAVKTAAAK